MNFVVFILLVFILTILGITIYLFFNNFLSIYCNKKETLDIPYERKKEKEPEETELEVFSGNVEDVKEKKHWLETNLSRSYQLIPQLTIRETSDFRQSTEQLRSLLSPEHLEDKLSKLSQKPAFFHSDSVLFKNENTFTKFIEMHQHASSSYRAKKSINHNISKPVVSTILEDDDDFISHTKSIYKVKALAVHGVYFTCPELGLKKIRVEQLYKRIKDHIHSIIANGNSAFGACLSLYSFNKDPIKIQTCVEILCEYLKKLIENPDDEKFHRIELNEEFEEKVLKIEGALEFLNVVGYTKDAHSDSLDDRGKELTLRKEKINEETLLALKTLVKSTTPITGMLLRDLQVLMPLQVIQRSHLPSEFYQFSYNDPISQCESRGNKTMLGIVPKGKTMKERQLVEETRELSRHPFTLIRVLFPDSFTLQGTFESREKVGNVYEFVRENLVDSQLEYLLSQCDGEDLNQLEDSLGKQGLSPGATLHFKPRSSDSPNSFKNVAFLKPQIIALVEKEEINSS